jgi:Sulfotransferase family
MTLSVDELEAAASCAGDGLSDFGGDDHRPGLRVLLDAATSSPHAGPELEARVRHSAIGALVSRLRSQAGWAARPDCLERELPAQLVVIGLPRSGTTALHQILAADIRHQWIPAWLAPLPRPRPPVDEWIDDPDHRRAVEADRAAGPNALHDVRADDPEECLQIMRQSMVSMLWVSSMPVPEYHEWFIDQDERPSYRRYRDNLALIGADDPRRIWLLKNPSHTFGLAAMFDEFPEAQFVHIHRDPAESIVSGCSLISAMGLGAGTFSASELGAHRLRIWAMAAERMEAARAAAPERTVFDVDYCDFVTDPLRTVGEVYDALGRDLPPETVAAMERWVGERPKDQHGAHRYAAEDFGLTEVSIRDRMGDFIDRYRPSGRRTSGVR